MHIPDGFLNTPVTLATGGISAVALAYSLKRVNETIKPEQIPLMGLMASFVFMIQLFSFPIGVGTSIHLTGALLISILLGPMVGFLIMTVSLLALALLFQHGGLLSLGANILNMAGVGCFIGYGIYRLIPSQRSSLIIAGLLSGIASAVLCSFELALSGMLDLSSAFKTMLLIYGLTGLIEGVITLFILEFLRKVKPELVEGPG
ncbi:MAG: energy-coupling factor ABC transporter permease [Candidatus Marinimicrobia bacterium]|nr:energy-coupling factor ABC transporter permease [Candidatus Neomarinimicrobiota bacterium]